MTIALLKQRRELNKRKLAALAFLARSADVDEWPERLEGLAKKPEALGNEGMIRSLVQEVVQAVAAEGALPVVYPSPQPSAEERGSEAPSPQPSPEGRGGEAPSPKRRGSATKGE